MMRPRLYPSRVYAPYRVSLTQHGFGDDGWIGFLRMRARFHPVYRLMKRQKARSRPTQGGLSGVEGNSE